MIRYRYTIVYLILLFFAVTGDAEEPPILPLINKAMRSQLRSVYQKGLIAGNRTSVFAKVGDSITRTPHFLKDIGCGVEVLAGNQRLAPTITFFRGTPFPDSFTTAWCGIANSFTRDSVTAQNGWTVDEPLKRFSNPSSECPPPYDNPLRCELHLLKPSIALIMLGTNDLEKNDTPTFRKKLTRIVQETMVNGVVPVLSTIPPRLDNPVMGERVAQYNQIIQEVADTLQVPLWNYWLTLQSAGMINNGMDDKGIHPNVLNDNDPAVFTSEGLRYGFNQRNFTAVEVLKKLKAVVQNNAPSDAATSPNFTIYPDQRIAPVQRGTTVTFKVKIARLNLTDPVTFSLKGHPAGVSATFTTNILQTSTIVTLTVRSGVKIGEHRITIEGTTGALIRSTTAALIVNE